jgi:hypothetical protein
MNILLVTYDLKKPGADYTGLYEVLKTAPNWYHFLDSCWLLSTNETPSQWFEKVRSKIDQNDNIFIVDISRQPRQGWLNKDVWDWINTH